MAKKDINLSQNQNIFILVDDSTKARIVNGYWNAVNDFLQTLSQKLNHNNNQSGYQLLFLNHKIHNFTETVKSPMRVKYLMGFSPRGQIDLSLKLKDLFYGVSGKGKSLVMVITPDTDANSTISDMIQKNLPPEAYLHWFSYPTCTVFPSLKKVPRCKVMKLPENQSGWNLELVVSTQPPRELQNTCCCIC